MNASILRIDSAAIDFAKSPLVPAIVRDRRSGAVLMLAYMNREALERSLESGETWFWSRSRNALWNKGATSGNRQRIVSIAKDCDGDALLIDVDPAGPACHTGATSCFDAAAAGCSDDGARARSFTLRSLVELLESRRSLRPAGSYTASLFSRGTNAILKKIGEESAEVIIAATGESRERLVSEVADLAFHVVMLLVDRGIDPDEITEELRRRSVPRC